MVRAVMMGTAILAPIAVGGTVLVVELNAPTWAVVGFFMFLGFLCAGVGALLDARLDRKTGEDATAGA